MWSVIEGPNIFFWRFVFVRNWRPHLTFKCPFSRFRSVKKGEENNFPHFCETHKISSFQTLLVDRRDRKSIKAGPEITVSRKGGIFIVLGGNWVHGILFFCLSFSHQHEFEDHLVPVVVAAVVRLLKLCCKRKSLILHLPSMRKLDFKTKKNPVLKSKLLQVNFTAAITVSTAQCFFLFCKFREKKKRKEYKFDSKELHNTHASPPCIPSLLVSKSRQRYVKMIFLPCLSPGCLRLLPPPPRPPPPLSWRCSSLRRGRRRGCRCQARTRTTLCRLVPAGKKLENLAKLFSHSRIEIEHIESRLILSEARKVSSCVFSECTFSHKKCPWQTF